MTAEITPAVQRAAVAVKETVCTAWPAYVSERMASRIARDGLAAALDVEEMARALFDLDNPDLGDEWREMAWNDMGGSERSEERVQYELKATSLRAALLGADS